MRGLLLCLLLSVGLVAGCGSRGSGCPRAFADGEFGSYWGQTNFTVTRFDACPGFTGEWRPGDIYFDPGVVTVTAPRNVTQSCWPDAADWCGAYAPVDPQAELRHDGPPVQLQCTNASGGLHTMILQFDATLPTMGPEYYAGAWRATITNTSGTVDLSFFVESLREALLITCPR